MNKGLFGTICGFIGAVVGSVTTWFVAKHINDKTREKEVNEFLKAFGDDQNPKEDEGSESKPTTEEKSIYTAFIEENGYISNPQEEVAHSEEPPKKARYADKKVAKKRVDRLFKAPYLIEDYEFDEENDYRKITLTYYTDGVLVDEIGTKVEAPSILGENALSSFGDSDSIYVRNERLRCDYEVLKDDQSYSNVVAKKPYLEDSGDEDDE